MTTSNTNEEIRRSHGVLLLARRTRQEERAGRDQLLLNWNAGWGAFAFIGGHLEAEDRGDPLACARRELIEETGAEAIDSRGRRLLSRDLVPGADFIVGPLGSWKPRELRYSKSKGVMTDYRFDLTWLRFLAPEAELSPLWTPPERFRWFDLEPLLDPARCHELQVSDFPLPEVLQSLTSSPGWRERWPPAFDVV